MSVLSFCNSVIPSAKCRTKIYHYLSVVVCLGLSTVLLWALVSYHDPQAQLLKLSIDRNVVGGEAKVYVELEIINKNYFRGFDYRAGASWVEFFYVQDVVQDDGSSTPTQQLTWNATLIDVVQGFDSRLRFNQTIVYFVNTDSPKDWDIICDNLEAKAGHIYVSLVLSYWYKILIWTTESYYYQWLNAHVNLTNTLHFDGPVPLTRTLDFSLALSAI